MKIREATLQDCTQLDQLLTQLIREEAQFDPNLNSDCIVTDNYCHRIGLEDHRLLAAEENGQIVGFAYGFLHHIPGIYRNPIAILDALYIAPDHRRKGYASQLLSHFLAFASQNGVNQIELKVLSNNVPALSLYERTGFWEMKKYMKISV